MFETFPIKMKCTKCSAKEKKRGGEKAKSKSQDCCVTILLSAHAQSNILHLDQKAIECMTCKWFGGKF